MMYTTTTVDTVWDAAALAILTDALELAKLDEMPNILPLWYTHDARRTHVHCN